MKKVAGCATRRRQMACTRTLALLASGGLVAGALAACAPAQPAPAAAPEASAAKHHCAAKEGCGALPGEDKHHCRAAAGHHDESDAGAHAHVPE